MNNQMQQVVTIINQGGIVIFPTDTAFGIGCRMDNEDAIKRLFQIRKRPETKAVPVLVSSVAMAKEYFLPIPDDVEQLLKQYWPGALTVVFPCHTDKVPTLVRGGENTIGMRMPNNYTALELIKQVGIPILGTSANFAGEKTPFRFEDLDPELLQLVDYVVPGECTTKQASTVIDCSVMPWKVLRQGTIKLKI